MTPEQARVKIHSMWSTVVILALVLGFVTALIVIL